MKNNKTASNTPRGIRNNNPGNIRRSSSKWQGKVPHSQSTDKEFEQFTSMAYGVRAMARLIHTYITKYKVQNLEEVVLKYAPSVENNTESYIRAVEKRAKINRLAPIKSYFYKDTGMFALIEAMTYHENGRAVKSSDISKGISMTGLL